MRYDDRVVKVVVALVGIALGGCSFATMHAPHGSPPECTESTVAPVADVLIAVASPFIAYAILDSQNDESDPESRGVERFVEGIAAVGISFPVWGIFGTSSIYGFVKAGRCERAKRDYQQLMNAPPGPGVYAPPPIAPPPSGAPPPVYPAPPPAPVPAPAP
jgi:hypothetical protein